MATFEVIFGLSEGVQGHNSMGNGITNGNSTLATQLQMCERTGLSTWPWWEKVALLVPPRIEHGSLIGLLGREFAQIKLVMAC